MDRRRCGEAVSVNGVLRGGPAVGRKGCWRQESSAGLTKRFSVRSQSALHSSCQHQGVLRRFLSTLTRILFNRWRVMSRLVPSYRIDFPENDTSTFEFQGRAGTITRPRGHPSSHRAIYGGQSSTSTSPRTNPLSSAMTMGIWGTCWRHHSTFSIQARGWSLGPFVTM
jgi:hypothetical protein